MFVLTINNLGHSKVCNGGDGGDGLVLRQVEGPHHEAACIDVGVVEGAVQAGHGVDVAGSLQAQVVLQSRVSCRT